MGRLVDNGTITHSYPFCWRSDTPLIYRAMPSWFVKVEQIKERLIANNMVSMGGAAQGAMCCGHTSIPDAGGAGCSCAS